jgi:predicted DNA-binding helix-hairpin-helix protein
MAPAVRSAPSLERKLEALGQAARHDLSCACGEGQSRVVGADGRWIYPAVLPSGGRVPLLKILQEGGCERGCLYCAQRHGGGPAGACRFSADELARLFADLRRAGRVAGLFLSSAIRGGPVRSMDRLLATAELVRHGGFRGYVHLKLIPGCRSDQVERALEVATRVSVNLEAPTVRHLKEVAPAKRFAEQLLAPMRQVAAAEAAGRGARAGQTTQFVVGAADESDRDLGRATAWLYRRVGLRRVYYSAFQPIAGTPLQARPPTSPVREHRLYQMDFLLRRYGFAIEEIPFTDDGALPLTADPKTLWAARHPERFPVEVNRAPPEELMRVPGIGPRAARRLVQLRAAGRLRGLGALRAAGAAWRVAAPYLLVDGRRAAQQLELFAR